MLKNKPLISIITPCLNRAHMLEEAIESVLNQDYDNVEHIIIDGGSTDGTLELLKKYKHIKFISEPDKNLYDGLNKGIRLAKGDIIGHLNSDDCYEENCFSSIVAQFNGNPEKDSICGGASIFEVNHLSQKHTKAIFNHSVYKDLRLDTITYGMPIINARFFRKAVYDRIGQYDIQYRIAADREFLLRAYVAGIKTLNLEKIIYHYRHHSGSLTINNIKTHLTDELHPEYLKILSDYKKTTSLPKEVYKACRNWHTWMVGYNMSNYIRAFDLPASIRMIKKGYSEDRFFVLRFLLQKIRQKQLSFLK